MADTSKTGFGFDQIVNETPEWANWIFRGWFIISKAIIGYLGTLMAIKGISISLTTFLVISATISMLGDPIMYGFSKLFGIVPEQAEPGAGLVADKQITDGGTKAVNPVVVEPVAADNPTRPASIK